MKVSEIIENPEKWAPKAPINQLVTFLRMADARYHNNEAGVTIPDSVYDYLREVLVQRSSKNSYFKKAGSPIKKRTKKKVNLPFYMGSLDKIKADNTENWLRRNPGPYVLMDKQDGLSLGIVYRDGNIGLYTRGDGFVGLDVSHLAEYLDLPKLDGDFMIRAEIQMRRSVFAKKYADEFENPRNTVAGAVNRLKVNTAISEDLEILAYDIVNSGLEKSCQLRELKRLGFKTPNFKVAKTLSVDYLTKTLERRKTTSDFEMDGLVIELDSVNEWPVGENPKHSVAFKTGDVEVTTTVVGVYWEESKHGYFKPVVHIEPVELAGVTVRKATGFNAKFIKDNGVGPKATVSICRSGDVIPFITNVIKSVTPQMPIGEWEWNDTGVDAVATGPASDTVHIKQITHFFKTLKIEDLGPGRIKLFYDAGLTTIHDILYADAATFLDLDGIQERMATKVYNNIRQGLTDVKMPILMDASGMFGRGFGTRKMGELLNTNPDILERKLDEEQAFEAAMNTPGFSEKSAKRFARRLPRFKRFLSRMPDYFTIAQPEEVNSDSALNGQQIVFTGFRNPKLEEQIVINGGVMQSSVNSKTTILVVKDAAKATTKTQKAEKIGVRVIGIAEFVAEYMLEI